MEIEPTILARLVHSRDLLNLAKRLRTQKTRIADAEALVLLDAAIESALPALLAAKDVRIPGQVEFVDVVELVVAKLVFPRAKAASFGRLHHARNQIQHHGLVPDETQRQQLGQDAVTSLQELLVSTIGVPLERISISELVHEPLAKELYRRAEESRKDGNPAGAVVCLVAAFEQARQTEQARIYGSGITWSRASAKTRDGGPPPHTHDGITSYAEKIHEEVEVLKLGLDYKAYRRYTDISPSKLSPMFVQHLPSGKDAETLLAGWHEYLGAGVTSVTDDWLEFAFQFVRDTILRWESLYRSGLWEDIEKALDSLATLFNPKKKE